MNAFQTAWKQLAANRSLTSSDMAVLALSKAARKEDLAEQLEQAKYYLRKSFKPITKQSKLAGGAYPNGALYFALCGIKSSSAYKAFDTLWGEQMRDAIDNLAFQLKGGYGKVNI